MVIAPNGTFVGEPGFPRGNVKRTEPGFSDVPMVHLITEAPIDPMCKDTQKSPSSQSSSSPRLNVAAGANVALRFQENGHVTLPENQAGKPENRGDIFVYGTTQPKDNELFHDVHGVWTADGKGGDGRGVLLAKAAYDDGQCYQVNGGAISTDRQSKFKHAASNLMGLDLWCQTDVQLPSDAPSGQPYTLYWVWQWPTVSGVDPNLPNGKNETYTTCMDVAVNAAGDFSQKVADGGYIQGQPVENAAVPDQFAKLGEQPSANAPAQSTPAASPAPAAAAPLAAEPAAAPPAPAPQAPAASAPAPLPKECSPAAPVQSASAADAPAPPSSSPGPPPAPPFPAQTMSANRTLTTLQPIPAPSAPSAGSAPASSASASSAPLTALSPIPPPKASSGPPSDASATDQGTHSAPLSAASGWKLTRFGRPTAATSTVIVTATPNMADLMSMMATMSMPSDPVTTSRAALKIRGRMVSLRN
jgi:hypothetical protein